MAEISINTTTFAAGGGSYRIELTKEDAWAWGSVTVSTVSWVDVGEMTDVSPFLYTIDLTVDANTSGTSRTLGISVTVNGQSELFTITQPSASAVNANVNSVSPSGNIAASGGQITVDVESVNGTDSLSSAAVTTGNGYCTLTSTTHGVASGGLTVTRFVFTVDPNSGTSTRSIVLTFTVSDGNTTVTATVSKTQLGLVLIQGTMSASDVALLSSDTSGQTIISQTDMDMSTVTATPAASWISDAQVTVQGGQYVCLLTCTANTNASARTTTVVLSGTDTYGNTITATFSVTQDGTSIGHKITAYWNSPDTGVLSWAGGTQNMRIQYTGTFTGNETVTINSTWPGLTKTRNSYVNYDISYAGGNIDTQQVVPITVSRVGDDSVTYTATLNLILQPGGVFPIWKDTYGAIASDEDWEDYELQENSVAFYTGRAFKYPDEGSINVNVSRVVAPYLTDYYKDVEMYSDGTLILSATFVRDYSYDTSIDYSQNQPLARPINGVVPSGIKMLVSEWAATSSGSLQVTDEGGALVVNEALVKGLNTAEFIVGAAGKEYTFGAEKYRVVDACRGAVLKYVNAYGGWDFFLVEGVVKKNDKITRASYEKDADALSQQFETRDYQAAMEASWQGTTGWLTDSQSARMKHLVESVEVYMIDLSNGDEIPVVMRDGNLDYKTWWTNGRKLINYTLVWTESQKKIRR